MFKTLGLALMLFSPSIFAASTNVHGLIANEIATGDSVSFDCSLNAGGAIHTHHIEVNKDSQQLAIRMNDGVEFKAAAVATRFPNLKKTFYYFSNGNEPRHYDFTVSINDDGSAATFQMVANALIFDCKH
jgi:hypothetical protein